MNDLDNKLKKDVVVINELGLHARPAAMLANIAMKAESDIWLSKDGDKVDASSIIDILSLACFKGSRITIQAENPSDIDILNEITSLFEKGFKE